MERGVVTFDDVAVYFTEEEWRRLQEEEKSLYKEVMNDNYQMILSLNRPDLITNIELGCDLYISTARAGAIQDPWHEEQLAASDRSIFQEDTRSEAPLKRQRRYPRVNPLRWIKTHKKSKSRSQRTSHRSEHREHETSPEWPVEARDSEEGSSGVHTKCSSISVQPNEQEVEQRHLQTVRRPGEGDPRSCITSRRDVRYRPDLRVTLNISQGEDSQVTPGNGEGPSDQGHNRLHTERATSMADAAPPARKDPTDINGEDGPTPCCRDTANPPPTPTKTTDLMGTEGSVHPDCTCDEMKATSPWKREKRVKFSDTVTTFIFGAEATENTERGPELRSKYRPFLSHVTSTREPRNRDVEYVVPKSQDSKPNATPPKRRTAGVHDTLEAGGQDLKTPNSMRFIKKIEEAEGSPPCMESGSDLTETPPSTGAQKKDVGTQIDLIHKEEDHHGESKIQLTPPPSTNTEQNFIKSYACTNCGKTTHWTKLNEQQKADAKRSTLHICKMCHRQSEKNKATLSPHKDSSTQYTGRASMARSLARKKPHYSPLDDSSNDGPMTKKKHKVNGEAETQRSPANHNIHLKKVEESLSICRNHDVQLKKVEESPSTSNSHNIQLKKGEESQRMSTNHNGQLNEGKESPRTSINHNGQLKKGEESPRTSTNHNGQLKKEESPRTSSNHNGQLKKGEESPRTLANRNVHVMNVEQEIVVDSTNNADHRKKCSATQDTHTDNKSSLCSQCGDCGAPEDAKLHHKVKSINGTPKRAADVASGPDLKIYTPERRKSNKVLQNGTSSVQEEKLSSSSRSSRSTISHNHQKNGVQANKGGKHDLCGKLLKGQKIKPLTSIQHKRPVRGGQKQSIKSDAVRKERVKKKSPDEPKEKKSQSKEDPKSPRPARGSRDRVLCTKCGKRMALHVTPSQGSPNEGGSNENECVVLPRKKRKRPLAGMEPFTCKECGKIFTRHFTLLQHRFIHTGERPYACKVCGKKFRDGSYLIVHMRSHTKEKPYSCTECGKCFSQNSALHVHLRTHSDERPFCCQDCGKSFTDRSTYRHHLRIHTGEKPYACSFCGKKFTQQPHMKRHETIHTGERPFGCAQCGKRFIERTKLKKHELVHQKGKD